MAVDMFFKMDPLKGESVDSKHKGEIDVLAWSWGMSQSGSAHMGGGAGSGKVSIQDLSLTKWVDNTSPDLMLACCKGTHYTTAELVVRKAGGAAPLEYIKIYLEEIIISSISTGGSGGEDRLTENISLNFATAKWEYTPQDAKGGAGKKNGPLGWNIQKNEKI